MNYCFIADFVWFCLILNKWTKIFKIKILMVLFLVIKTHLYLLRIYYFTQHIFLTIFGHSNSVH